MPGAVAVALFAWWAVADGGYAPGARDIGAVALVAFAAAALVTALRRGGVARTTWIALGCLGGFAAWSFVSVAWADARGDAWEASNLALVYAVVFAAFALPAWRAGTAAALLGGWAVAVAVVCGVAAASTDGFFDGRLTEPIGYPNATGGLLLVAFWPALLLAARRATPWWLRAPLLAAAGLLADLGVMTQSRGALAASAVAAVAALALSPERGRVLAALGAVVVVGLASLDRLLAVFSDGPETALGAAWVAIGLSMVLLAGVAAASQLADKRAARVRRPLPRAARLGVVAVVIGGTVVALAGSAAGSPPTRLAAGYSTGRYAFWHVAADTFLDHPVAGVGAGGFAQAYALGRRSWEEPLHAHSLPWEVLATTGAVGALLLAGFLLAAAVPALRLPDGAEAMVVVAALVTAVQWIVQASADWLWEVPAVTAPVVAFLGLAAARSTRPAAAGAPAPGRPWAAGAAALAPVAAVSLALPALAAGHVEHAAQQWRADPGGALDELRTARRLNPLSDRADVVAGVIAERTGRTTLARRDFGRAIDRNAGNWYAQLQLGLLELEDGDRDTALRSLERARTLDPMGRLVDIALAGGGRVTDQLADELWRSALPGPAQRRSIDCTPVLGPQPTCTADEAGLR